MITFYISHNKIKVSSASVTFFPVCKICKRNKQVIFIYRICQQVLALIYTERKRFFIDIEMLYSIPEIPGCFRPGSLHNKTVAISQLFKPC